MVYALGESKCQWHMRQEFHQHILSNCAGVGENGNELNMSQKLIPEFLNILRHSPIPIRID